MALRTRVKVEGLRELDAALSELSRGTARNVLRKVLMAAGEPIAEEAARLAPKDTLELSKSIAVSPRLINKVGQSEYATVLKGGGSRAEAVQALRNARRDANGSFAEVYVGPGKAPTKADAIKRIVQEFGGRGRKAQPYLRPAFDSKAEEALSIIKRDLSGEVDKAVARARRRASRKARG